MASLNILYTLLYRKHWYEDWQRVSSAAYTTGSSFLRQLWPVNASRDREPSLKQRLKWGKHDALELDFVFLLDIRSFL